MQVYVNDTKQLKMFGCRIGCKFAYLKRLKSTAWKIKHTGWHIKVQAMCANVVDKHLRSSFSSFLCSFFLRLLWHLLFLVQRVSINLDIALQFETGRGGETMTLCNFKKRNSFQSGEGNSAHHNHIAVWRCSSKTSIRRRRKAWTSQIQTC